MNVLKLIIVFSCFYTSLSWAGTIDEFSRSVVFLTASPPVMEDVNGTPCEVWLKLPGTNGFVIKRKTIAGSGLIVISSNVAYLITAKHVAVEMGEDCDVIMRGDTNEPLHLKLIAITGQPQVKWIHHTNADISIHPMPSITQAGIVALNRRSAPLDLLEKQPNLPSRDIYVTVLGFPLGLGATGEFIPLSRESKVTSGMLNDAEGRFFLLQDPSVSGYSGGPLIESGDPRVVGVNMVTGGARCWGFVKGTYGDETGGKMSRITPSLYAVELIRQYEHEGHITEQTNTPPAHK